jgi:hypothetical protein
MEKLVPTRSGSLDRKSSTTSSLYIDETMVSPKMPSVLMAMATLLSTQLSEGANVCASVLMNPDFACFCEEKYFAERALELDPTELQLLRAPPTPALIFEFIDGLSRELRLTYGKRYESI